MSLRGFAVIIALYFASLSAYSNTTSITATVESPVDGSLWIGTSGEGIFRLGRNGKSLHYCVDSGHLTSNSIVSLGFDINKVLWILDTTGALTRYSSVKGFEKELSISEAVTAFSLSKNLDKLFICTLDLKLYVYDISSGVLNEPQILPSVVNSILPSVEDFSLWAICSDGTLRIGEDGVISTWESGSSVSNTIPFVFETFSPQNVSRGRNKLVRYLLLLVVVLLIALVSVLYRFLFYSCSKHNQLAKQEEPHVEVIPLQEADQSTSSVTLDNTEARVSRARVPLNTNITPQKPGEFTRKVQALIQEHISDPDFDVESIAAITGMSRIHVNRKLKAESAPSPSVMLKEARMAKASALLKENTLTIAQICKICGFSRPSYFATAFKEYFGVTPSEYIESSK